jgi:AbrB family transcriptional regulator (stage V sporulation protein T)
MKATGIVRRIDDLGRVVIPKEIRRTMRIREGDPLEIFTGANGEVVFKKYSPIGELGEIAAIYAESLSIGTKLPIIICDRDHCIAAAGISKKEVIERRVTPFLEGVMEDRKTVSFDSSSALEGIERQTAVAAPILSAGDVCGAVVLLTLDDGTAANEGDVNLARVAATFLGKQLED